MSKWFSAVPTCAVISAGGACAPRHQLEFGRHEGIASASSSSQSRHFDGAPRHVVPDPGPRLACRKQPPSGANASGGGGVRAPTDPATLNGAREDVRSSDPGVAPVAPVLTVDELASLLRLNRKTVYDALSRGEIPGARRVGSSYRILRAAVIEWLASGQGRVSHSKRLK